jgi:hypothetical protein
MVGHAWFDRRRGAARAAHPLLGLLLALIIAGLIGLAIAALFGQLAAEGSSADETAAVLAMLLNATLLGMLVFDLHEAVSTLVADSDLELLRRAPIRPGELFLLKLLDALPRTSTLLLVLALPAIAAYHAFHPLPRWAWLLLPLQLLALWAIPLGLGIALGVLFLRLVPAARARQALGLVSTLTLFGLWMANSFLLPRLADHEGDPIARLRVAWGSDSISPGHWISRAVAGAASGEIDTPLVATVALVAIAVASLVAAALVASHHLEAAQARIAAGPGRRRARRATRPRALGRTTLLGAVLRRDARLLARDWTVLGDVMTAVILWTLLPLVGAPVYTPSSHLLARAMLLALSVGLGYEVAARALPFERRGTVWMRIAPVAATRFVAAKLAGAAALSLPLVLIAAAGTSIGFSLSAREALESLAVTAPALALSLAVGLWTGARFGNPEWTNPRAMLTLSGRALATVMLLVQAAAWLMWFGFAESARAAAPDALLIGAPIAVTLVIAIVPLRATARIIERREWSG